MARPVSHALLADESAALHPSFGCLIWFIGLIVAAYGAYILFHDGPGTIPNAIMIVGGLIFVVGALLQRALARTYPNSETGYPMLAVGVQADRLLWGRTKLRWDIDETAELPSGHYRVGSLEDVDLKQADPSNSVLAVVIQGGTKSKHFEIKGITFAEGDAVRIDAVGLGVMSMMENDSYATMTPDLMSPQVSAVEGLMRLDGAVAEFPPEMKRRVLVVSPQTAKPTILDYVLFGVVGGTILSLVDEASDKRASAKMKELVDRDLVYDKAAGTSLLEFCSEHGWELVVE